MDGMTFRPSDRIRMLLPRQRRASSTSRVIPVICSQSVAKRKIVTPICDFEGFYPPESEQDVRFAWTHGEATVTCHFLSPVAVRHLWLPIYSTRPGGTSMSISIEQGPRLALKKVVRNRIVRISFGRKLRASTIRFRLECETFTPHSFFGNDDHRELGIALRRIIFGRSLFACLRGLQGDVQVVEPWEKRGTNRAA